MTEATKDVLIGVVFATSWCVTVVFCVQICQDVA